MRKSSVYNLVLVAMFAALITVCAWISFPLPFTQVPISLATMAVGITACLLGWKRGTLAVIVYVLLGIAGVPVFAQFSAGLGVIAGPTGGYIVGYIVFAFVTGILLSVWGRKKYTVLNVTGAVLIGLFFCYLLGTLWYVVSMHVTPIAALTLCVVPFIPGDILKTIVTVILAVRLKPVLARMESGMQQKESAHKVA
ncbi:MAG: biotin transporter BioY [Anaerovoracaceae bacterium]|jgi:biotin transport system substrate-specific component